MAGTSIEVYERIGRGAMACWFGANGFLKTTHIYEATAEPAHKGGQAEIIIRERDNSTESPRGVKAFQIQITPSGSDETSVTAENLKLPEATAQQMKNAVAAWSTGKHGCDTTAFAGAWQPDAAPPPPASKEKTTQRGARVAKQKP